MLNWAEFEKASPDLASTGVRLLERNEVAFLATVSATGRPRIHPFVPKVIEGRMVAFIMDSSPKFHDLKQRHQFSIHTLPGDQDEEFFFSGRASCCNDESECRSRAGLVMGFATGIDEHHILYEFRVDRALWTRWLDFGTANHRPDYVRWKA